MTDYPGMTGEAPRDAPLWVFAYGSLMWNPGFPFTRECKATLFGYHRSLCVRSVVYRGTPERPGLVLGLEPGGCCVGKAFRVADSHRESAWRYLHQRELVTDIYRPRVPRCTLGDGRQVRALTFVVRRDHPQYSGHLQSGDAASTVAAARGCSGPNTAYVHNTVVQLAQLGICDRRLTEIVALLPAGP